MLVFFALTRFRKGPSRIAHRRLENSNATTRLHFNCVMVAVQKMTDLMDDRTVNKANRRVTTFLTALNGHFNLRIYSFSKVINALTTRNLLVWIILIVLDSLHVLSTLIFSRIIAHIQRVEVFNYLRLLSW